MINTPKTSKSYANLDNSAENSMAISSPEVTESFDISNLRIPSNFGTTLGIKKVLNVMSVDKPPPTQLFRTHMSQKMQFNTILLPPKGTQETYLTTLEVTDNLSGLIKPVTLMLVIERQAKKRLVPVTFPGVDGQHNLWHQSMLSTLTLAQSTWIRPSISQSRVQA